MKTGTQSYAETTLDQMFGIPGEFSPRFVRYTTAMDNHEPTRKYESGRLVEYDDSSETSGQPRYMMSRARTDIPEQSIIIIDDGKTARPYYLGLWSSGNPAPIYPEGSEPKAILMPFPVNPDGKTRADNGRVIDYTAWYLGPRKAYLLKITRDAPAPMADVDSLLIGYVSDAIERIGGKYAALGYDAVADMAAEMLTRFPAVRFVAAAYARDEEEQGALDHTVLDALGVF